MQPEFLLTDHPGIPPVPYKIFPPGATIIGFDFNYYSTFGPIEDIYIAEFGSVMISTIGGLVPQYTGIGHRISKIDVFTGGVTTFAINKSGLPSSISREGGFERPADSLRCFTAEFRNINIPTRSKIGIIIKIEPHNGRMRCEYGIGYRRNRRRIFK